MLAGGHRKPILRSSNGRSVANFEFEDGRWSGKELVCRGGAYNLVHTFMEAAAREAGLEPRELSFFLCSDHVNASLLALNDCHVT